MDHPSSHPPGEGGPPREHRHSGSPSFARFLIGFSFLALLVPTPSFAQDPITEVIVIYGGSSGIQPPAGYTKIPIDLNQGADGDYIYVCYKRGIGAPITGLAVTLENAAPPVDAAYTRIDVDLNRGAGGDFIWLWYTRDPACSTIRGIHVQNNTGSPPSGYQRINVDLNRGAGGAFIYLSYLKF